MTSNLVWKHLSSNSISDANLVIVVKVFRLIPECKLIVVVNVAELYLQKQIDFSADRVIISWRVNPPI